MITQNNESKINWRQILIHAVAAWFFMAAFQTLSYLYNVDLIKILRQSNFETGTEDVLKKHGISMEEFTAFLLFTNFSALAGLLVAFIISLFVSSRQHWYWINSLLAFILTYILFRFDLLGWEYLRKFFWYPGQLFTSTAIEFLVNGLILLAIGFLVLFLPRSKRFISKESGEGKKGHSN
ncbi:MAG TPA: hypothetical protein VFW07_24275 [Parafilimonas sp.]|nr:hypothetical protein [Parafilimonas sp.]